MSPHMDERVRITLDSREIQKGVHKAVIIEVGALLVLVIAFVGLASKPRELPICKIVILPTIYNNANTISPTLMNSEPNLKCAFLTFAPTGSDPSTIVISRFRDFVIS